MSCPGIGNRRGSGTGLGAGRGSSRVLVFSSARKWVLDQESLGSEDRVSGLGIHEISTHATISDEVINNRRTFLFGGRLQTGTIGSWNCSCLEHDGKLEFFITWAGRQKKNHCSPASPT